MHRLLLLCTMHYVLCSAGQEDETDRLVVTFHSPADAQNSTFNIHNASVVKQYGRRLILQFPYAVDLTGDGDAIQQQIGPEIIERIELDHRVVMQDITWVDSLTVDPVSVPGAGVNYEMFSGEGQALPLWNLLDREPFSIHAEEAWRYTNGSLDTVVAVLDTGLAVQVRDAFLSTASGYDFISEPGLALDGDGRDGDPTDPGDWGALCPSSSWHGTRVASVLAARHDPEFGLGVKGVAQNITLMPIRVLGMCRTGYASDVADAIVWAAGGEIIGVDTNPSPARIISMSFTGKSECPSYLQSAITQASRLGSILIAAAGNAHNDTAHFFPANCLYTIAVAASTRGGTLAPYSNFGPTVDLAAPGGDYTDAIMTLTVDALGAGPEIEFGLGTSFSVPHVAGVAALLASVLDTQFPLSALLDALLISFISFDHSADCLENACGKGIVSARKVYEMSPLPPSYPVNYSAQGNASNPWIHPNDSLAKVVGTTTNIFDYQLITSSRPSGNLGTPQAPRCPSGAYAYTSSVVVSNTVSEFALQCPSFTYVCSVQYQYNTRMWFCGLAFRCCNSTDAVMYQSFAAASNECVHKNFQGVVTSIASYYNSATDYTVSVSFPGYYSFGWAAGYGALTINTFGSASGSTFVEASYNRRAPISFYCPSFTGDSKFQWYISGFRGTALVDALDVDSIYCSRLCDYCPVGSYSLAGAMQCTLCAGGTYSTAVGAGSCVSCPSGTFSQPGATGCTTCSPGTYSPGSASACPSCPAGKYTASSGAFACATCSVGTVSPLGATGCNSCPAGKYAAGGTADCLTCQAGTYSLGNAGSCSTCLAGTYSGASAGSCSPCPAGTFSSGAGAGACTPCPAGSYSGAGAQACTQCILGTYQTGTGFQSALACTPCRAGSYSITLGAQTSLSCVSCNPGTYSTASGAQVPQTCALCVAGSYQTGSGIATSSACTPCNLGTYSTASGASLSQACSLCESGKFSTTPAAQSSLVCTNCGAGTYQTGLGIPSSLACISCPAGAYSTTLGAATSQACTQCGTGKYSILLGAQSPATCSLCTAGTFQSGLGLASAAACSACPAGSFSPADGSSVCTVCAANTFVSSPGATQCNACTDKSCSQLMIIPCTTTTDTACGQNCVYPPNAGPGSGSQSCPWMCNQGYKLNTAGTGCDECLNSATCNVGFYRMPCTQGLTDGTCVACTNAPPNARYTSYSITASGVSDCPFVCNAGFMPRSSSGTCSLQPQTTFCCAVCTAGKFNSKCSATSPGTCEGCYNIK